MPYNVLNMTINDIIKEFKNLENQIIKKDLEIEKLKSKSEESLDYTYYRITFDGSSNKSTTPGYWSFKIIEKNGAMLQQSGILETSKVNRIRLFSLLEAIKIFRSEYGETIPFTIEVNNRSLMIILEKYMWNYSDNNWKNSRGGEPDDIDLLKELVNQLKYSNFKLEYVEY